MHTVLPVSLSSKEILNESSWELPGLENLPKQKAFVKFPNVGTCEIANLSEGIWKG